MTVAPDDQRQTVALLVSPPPEELGALFSNMVKLCDVEPNRLSTGNWKGLSEGINLGIDLLQIFSRFFLS